MKHFGGELRDMATYLRPLDAVRCTGVQVRRTLTGERHCVHSPLLNAPHTHPAYIIEFIRSMTTGLGIYSNSCNKCSSHIWVSDIAPAFLSQTPHNNACYYIGFRLSSVYFVLVLFLLCCFLD